MDFPVTTQLAKSTRAAPLHGEMRGSSTEWARVRCSCRGWGYRWTRVRRHGRPGRGQAALAGHVPVPTSQEESASAMAAATDVAGLKDALLGPSGRKSVASASRKP